MTRQGSGDKNETGRRRLDATSPSARADTRCGCGCDRYQQQLHEPRFRKLVAASGIQLHAIWDDPDFAWNDTNGGKMLADPKQEGKVKISTSFMRAFRKALVAKGLGTFPSSPGAPALWSDYMAPGFTPLGALSQFP